MAKILIIEDDLFVLNPLVEFLTLEGHEVSATSSGQDAIAIISSNDFDIIFCDIIMAGIKGTGVIHHLRNKRDDTPFVFLTAMVAEKDRLTGLRMGATGYIKKPYNTNDILECIENLDEHRTIAKQWLKKIEKDKNRS